MGQKTLGKSLPPLGTQGKVEPCGEAWKIARSFRNRTGPGMGSSSAGPSTPGSSSRAGGPINDSHGFPAFQTAARPGVTSWQCGMGGTLANPLPQVCHQSPCVTLRRLLSFPSLRGYPGYTHRAAAVLGAWPLGLVSSKESVAIPSADPPFPPGTTAVPAAQTEV